MGPSHGCWWEAAVPCHVDLSVGILECHPTCQLISPEQVTQEKAKQQPWFLLWPSLDHHKPSFLPSFIYYTSAPFGLGGDCVKTWIPGSEDHKGHLAGWRHEGHQDVAGIKRLQGGSPGCPAFSTVRRALLVHRQPPRPDFLPESLAPCCLSICTQKSKRCLRLTCPTPNFWPSPKPSFLIVLSVSEMAMPPFQFLSPKLWCHHCSLLHSPCPIHQHILLALLSE